MRDIEKLFESEEHQAFMQKLLVLEEDKKIDSEAEFREYATKILKKAHGDKFEKDKADKVIDGLLKDIEGSDYSSAIGRLTSGLGEDEDPKAKEDDSEEDEEELEEAKKEDTKAKEEDDSEEEEAKKEEKEDPKAKEDEEELEEAKKEEKEDPKAKEDEEELEESVGSKSKIVSDVKEKKLYTSGSSSYEKSTIEHVLDTLEFNFESAADRTKGIADISKKYSISKKSFGTFKKPSGSKYQFGAKLDVIQEEELEEAKASRFDGYVFLKGEKYAKKNAKYLQWVRTPAEAEKIDSRTIMGYGYYLDDGVLSIVVDGTNDTVVQYRVDKMKIKEDEEPKSFEQLLEGVFDEFTDYEVDRTSSDFVIIYKGKNIGQIKNNGPAALRKTVKFIKDHIKKEEKRKKMNEEAKTFEQLLEDSDSLTPAFAESMKLIFEEEVSSRVASEKEALEEQYTFKLSETTATLSEELEQKVDSQLETLAEEWAADNKVAIEASLRVRLAEEFMDKMKGLLEESYVEVPETKTDLVEQLEMESAELRGEKVKLEESINKLEEQINANTQAKILSEAIEELPMSVQERVTTLAEQIEFKDAEDYTSRINDLTEFYNNGNANLEPSELSEDKTDEDDARIELVVEEEEENELTPQMKQYVHALKRANK